jgi:hypothetical protein
VSFYVVEVSFFVEHETFALDEGHYLLQDVVGCEVDLVEQNPVSVFDGFDEVAFEEAEDEVAVDFI